MSEQTQTPSNPAEAELGSVSEEQIKTILEFDPFAPIEEKEAAAGVTPPAADGAAPAADKKVAKPDTSGAPAPDTQTPPAAAPAKTADQIAYENAMAQLEQLKVTVAKQAEALASVTKPAAPAAPAAAPEAPKPDYTVEVPDQLFEAIRSEDAGVARQGFNILVNSVMNRLAKDFSTKLEERSRAIVEHVSQAVPARMTQQSQEQQQLRAIHDDFYGTHKELDIPELKPIVTQVASQLAASLQQAGYSPAWTPEFRDAVATRVKQIMTPFAAAPAAPAPQPAPKPAAQIRSGVRPSNTSGLSSEQEEMVGLLGLNF